VTLYFYKADDIGERFKLQPKLVKNIGVINKQSKTKKMYSRNYLNAFNEGIQSTECRWEESLLSLDDFFTKINSRFNDQTRLFFYGNGASMAFASHMALDWHKNGKIESHTLSDVSLLTAYVNDYSKDEMFSEHLKSFKPKESDIICAISSSGNSSNVIAALNYANEVRATTISFSGLNPENKSIKNSEFSLFVPLKTYGQVECAHQLFLHMWLDKFMGITEWDRREVQNMDAKHFKL
jgi:D-sedoheptulose 7-phosphate isomerase